MIPMCIYVREITDEEGKKLQRLIRRSKDPVEMRRAAVVLQSAQGFKVREIARSQFYSEKHVRTIIKRFNEEGFSSLKSNYSGGRPPKFDKEIRLDIVDTAMSRPQDLGLPFTQWSLTKLKAYVIKEKVVDTISIERLRQILKEEGFSYQRSKTWKESTDPDFEAKKNE
jgi:transposase